MQRLQQKVEGISMGGGRPKNKLNNKANVTPSKRVQLSGTGAGGASGGDEGSENACIIAFDATLKVGTIANSPTPGDDLFFVPSDIANTFSVWFRAAELCAYSGPNASLMWRCANDGYEYHGNVTAVERMGSGLRIACRVETFGRE